MNTDILLLRIYCCPYQKSNWHFWILTHHLCSADLYLTLCRCLVSTAQVSVLVVFDPLAGVSVLWYSQRAPVSLPHLGSSHLRWLRIHQTLCRLRTLVWLIHCVSSSDVGHCRCHSIWLIQFTLVNNNQVHFSPWNKTTPTSRPESHPRVSLMELERMFRAFMMNR